MGGRDRNTPRERISELLKIQEYRDVAIALSKYLESDGKKAELGVITGFIAFSDPKNRESDGSSTEARATPVVEGATGVPRANVTMTGTLTILTLSLAARAVSHIRSTS